MKIGHEKNKRIIKTKVAGFPFLRTIEEYDFDFQPSIKKDKIQTIIESTFYEDGTNIVFIGNLGIGKINLAKYLSQW